MLSQSVEIKSEIGSSVYTLVFILKQKGFMKERGGGISGMCLLGISKPKIKLSLS